MTIETQRAYMRGYSRGFKTGRNNAWPAWAPPFPPEPHVRAMFAAAMQLRDAALGICQTLMHDDEFAVALRPGVDEIDRITAAVTAWLQSLPAPPAPPDPQISKPTQELPDV